MPPLTTYEVWRVFYGINLPIERTRKALDVFALRPEEAAEATE